MNTHAKSRRTERGTALLVVMIMTIVALGVIMALSNMVTQAAKLSTDRVDYSVALEVPEMALHEALRRIQSTSLDVVNDEYIGFVEADLDPGSDDTRTIWGSLNGVDYIVEITSAYQVHYTENENYNTEDATPATLEPAGGYLSLVPKGWRNDANKELFDYYHMHAYVTEFARDANGNILLDGGTPQRPVLTSPTGLAAAERRGIGQHNLRRGVEAVVKLVKFDVNALIPSALYIDGDPDPKLTGQIKVSGADHPMNWEDAAGGAKECPDCFGLGVVPSDPDNPALCETCSGDGKVEETCPTCAGIGRTNDCLTCGKTGEVLADCPTCSTSGRVTDAGAPGPTCDNCGGDGLWGKDNDKTCNKCNNVCPNCAGAGEVMTACPDCNQCATCAGDGTVSKTCETCGGTGSGEADQVACGTCDGDGLVPEDMPNGQVDEIAWRDPDSTNDKPAVQYPGTYEDLTDNADVNWTALITEDENGNEQTGATAVSNGDIDLRMLAEAFVGDLENPDYDRIDNVLGGGPTTYDGSLKAASDDGILGDKNTFKVTLVDGSADTVAGVNGGGGVLVVNGDMKITGQFVWYGLVIVMGNTSVTGGGNDKHVFGSLMCAEFISDTQYSDFDMTGNADIFWCQEAIDKVMRDLKPTFGVYPEFNMWQSIDKADIMSMED